MAGLVSLFLVLFVCLATAQDFLRTTTGSDLSNSYMYASGNSAVLFDTQLFNNDTDRVVFTLRNQVVTSVIQLRYIVITSTDPRSYLGLASVVAAFPNATVVATPGVANTINSKAASVIQTLTAAGVTGINTVVPFITSLSGNTLTVGSAVFTLTEVSQVGSNYITYVWNSATRTLFPGFVHYGLHPDLTFAVAADGLQKYQLTLRNFLILFSPINTLYPRFGPFANSPDAISASFTQTIQYVNDFISAVQPPNTRDQAFATLTFQYPQLQGLNFLTASIAAAIPACQPSCGPKVCGDDGCGGSCGACVAPATCNAYGQCECQANCNGRFCGDDGCGNSCGTCSFGTCGAAGTCVCVPSCAPNSCGADGCGGVCQCPSGTVCTGAFTCQAPSGNSVGVNLGFLGLVQKAKCQ